MWYLDGSSRGGNGVGDGGSGSDDDMRGLMAKGMRGGVQAKRGDGPAERGCVQSRAQVAAQLLDSSGIFRGHNGVVKSGFHCTTWGFGCKKSCMTFEVLSVLAH